MRAKSASRSAALQGVLALVLLAAGAIYLLLGDLGEALLLLAFEPGSGRFLHEVAAEVLGDEVPLAVVTG